MADVIQTIGSGGTHATIAAWLAATETLNGNRYIGELIDPKYEVDAGTLIAQVSGAGARTSTNYRWLRSAVSAGGYYRPERHTGPRVYVRWTGSGDQAGLRVAANEPFFRASGFALLCEDPQEVSGGNKYGFQIQGDNFLGSRLFTQIKDGGARQSGSPPLFYCYYINNQSGNNADAATFLNCIAYGSRYWKGAHYGFFYDNFSSNGGCFNCAAYSIRHTGGITGGFGALTAVGVKPRLVNCEAMDCSTGVFGLWESIALDPTNGTDPLSNDEPYQCAVSDYSLPYDLFTPRVSANRNGVDSRTVHAAPHIQDLRPTASSVVHGNGRDMSSIWAAFGLTPEDFDGIARPAGATGYLSLGWTIGPYLTASTPLATTAPTEEIKSIGSAAGRDYPTAEAYLEATDDQSLIYANKVCIGELYPDSDFAIPVGTRVIARRTIADARHYRELRPAAGQGYDPVVGRGVKIIGQGAGTTGENNLVEVYENHFRLTGPLLVEQTFIGATDRRAIKVQGDDVRVDAVFGKFLQSTGAFAIVFLVRGSRVLLTNCIAKGSNSSGTGANSGFNIQSCEFSRVYCSTAWGIRGSGGGSGFREGGSTNRVEFSSCIGADCTSAYTHATSGNAPKTQSHCISSDATADGVGAQRSVPTASLLRNPSADDFRNASGSPAIKRGRNLTVRFSKDFVGQQRFAPFDCGAYDGLPPGPLFRAPEFRESGAFKTVFGLYRRDGVALLLTDQNEPVVYRGQTYLVGGAITASNRRGESQERSVGVRIALNSSQITAADLAAGRYRGARLVETLLGRYSFTQPIEENVYLLGQNRYDAEGMEVDFTSLSSQLARNAGRLVEVACGLRLGDEECTVDLSPNTLDDVRVGSTIHDPRRKFNANTADVSGSYANDYFGRGELIVLTGLNAGLVGQIKTYTASTRTFELEEAMPYNFATNDTFLVKPGCRLRYLIDCIGKHANGINYGGEPWMPGTDKSFATPQR